jgi:hypothetical protein
MIVSVKMDSHNVFIYNEKEMVILYLLWNKSHILIHGDHSKKWNILIISLKNKIEGFMWQYEEAKFVQEESPQLHEKWYMFIFRTKFRYK